MAAERGESVAFTCAYAGNLRELAGMIRLLEKTTGSKTTQVLEELLVLCGDQTETFDDARAKQTILTQYAARCAHQISGKRVEVCLSDLADSLEQKADWLTGWLRKHEWICAGTAEAGTTATMTITAVRWKASSPRACG